MKRAFWIIAGLIATGVLGWWLSRPPDPAEILAAIDVPDAPVLSPAEELDTFRLAPGFRAELIAAEPLVVDPVAMDWDAEGRLFVVEMRGFMPNITGEGEDQPIGRVVILTDHDGDGRMDESRVFLDGLVLPRAIAVLPEGVLIGVPPDLLLCRDTNGDDQCSAEERARLLDYASDSGNVEHRENGLLPGIDGWLYNSKSARRFQLSENTVTTAPTLFRGQWGIAQDDEGRLYYNHNSGFLYADLFPAEYVLRQPATGAALRKPGLNVDLAPGEQVFGVRVAPGLNRAYLPGTLRADGRQDGPTAVSGLVIQRGDQFGEEYKGHAFVPESAGAAVAHFALEADAKTIELEATHRLYPDEDYGEREFLASTDERFRPVDVKVGPDGAIWMIDMYRGVIQHAHYVSDYLREYTEKHELVTPGATGRIWRILREDRPINREPPALTTLQDQLAGLDHPNGWVRDQAQRRLIYDQDPAAIPRLRRLYDFEPSGQTHALWVLALRGELDPGTWQAGLASPHSKVRRTALRLSERLLDASSPTAIRQAATEALGDEDAQIRLQALHTLGSLPVESRPLDILLDAVAGEDEFERQAGLSGLADREEDALALLLDHNADRDHENESDRASIRAVSTAVFMQALSQPDRSARMSELLDRAESHRHASTGVEAALAIVDGILDAQELPGSERVVLDGPHPLFESDPSPALGEAVLRARRGFTWEGDPSPGGARRLDATEERLRARGGELFAATCATCHGSEGRGQSGLAPSLVGSPWLRDADAWLVRIALQGIRGPIRVGDQTWNSVMPGHGHDPRFDDEGVSGLLTFLRRAWGHADEPISAETVAQIRAVTRDHPEAWTVDELLALPVEHRLDRYVGVYRIPIVGIEISIVRADSQLEIGRSSGTTAPMIEIGDGVFSGEGMQIRFDPTEPGPAQTARVQFGSDSVEVSRTDDSL